MKLTAALLLTLGFTQACYADTAGEYGVTSFNGAWAGTTADNKLHHNVCTAVSWCSNRPRRNKNETVASPEAIKVAQQCEADTKQAIERLQPGALVAPCSAYTSPNPARAATPADYEQKVDAMRETITKLIETQNVGVFAFQEIRSEDVIKNMLGKYADRFETCAAPHSGFQTVGFAWKRSLTSKPGKCVTNQELAVREDPANAASHAVRPGVALELLVNGKMITFMNVHLKASCANLLARGNWAARTLVDPDPACRVFNRQVPILERWIESVARTSPNFVLLGDFNRRIDEEAQAAVPASEVRVDHTLPSSENVADASGYVQTKYLWQEISDGSPVLHQVALKETDAACKGFTGLDHIVVSDALLAQQKKPPTSIKTPVFQHPGQLIETSDHCPRTMMLGR
ncbi:MAG: endonuclease/exonuclease/phosphatase family protein [Pseudomonadota bacterium]